MKSNKKIRLIHLTTSLKIGGAETMLVDLIDQLKNHQFEQEVIYFHDGSHSERLRAQGIPIHHIKGVWCRYDPIFLIRLFLKIKKLKPDCIHALLWIANFAGRIIAHLLRIPIVCALHNNSDQNGKLRIWLDRLTVSSSDIFVAVSDEVKNSFRHYIPASRSASIKIITNGIDPARCYSQAMQLQKDNLNLQFSDEHFVIGSVGRFVPIKNYPLLLDELKVVVAKHPQVRLVLIGTGLQEEYLKQKIKNDKLDPYVTMIVNQVALPYYMLFDCFVLPSYKEGISMALLEAMSFGLPCVIGNHQAKHSVIQSGYNGLIVTPDSSFADVLLTLIEEPERRHQLAREGKQSVKKYFTLAQMVKSYADLFYCLSNRI